METILFLAHTEADGSLAKIALETLTGAAGAAKEVGGNLVVGLIGADVAAAANAIAECGATRYLGVSGPEFAHARYATDAAAAEAIAKASEATIILAPSTSRMCRALPGVARRLGGAIDTRAVSLAGDATAVQIKRWYYRQRMVATLSRLSRPWVILAEASTFEAYAGAPGSASVETLQVPVSTRTKPLRDEAASTGEQTIRPDAELLFVAGAGWTKKQADGQAHVGKAEALIRGFLTKSRASLGSSKSLVDQSGEGEVISFLTHMNQVGQTGASPRHAKGLSTCCHGEEPHVVGWRFVNERRAINLDPNCGWAQGKADVVYVADAFAVISKVNDLLG
jgi:electron transfer flavoprotein alpha subunit